MAVVLGNLDDAPRSAAAEDDKARKAAEEIAAHGNRFAKPEADVGLLKWMVGFTIAMSVAIFGKLPLGAHEGRGSES